MLQGLSAKFSQATDIMRWLKEAANTSTRNTQQPVSWTTPLGLRCVQPYLINVRLGSWHKLEILFRSFSTLPLPDSSRV